MNTSQNRPLASVIIISYNDETHIETAIQSVCEQTFSDIEIICVDDGSTDTTYERMLRCADQDERIKVIQQKNSGILAARYEGLQHVSSTYTFFLDSDDTLLPEAVETAYNAAEVSGADVVEFGIILFMNDQDPAPKNVWNTLMHYCNSQEQPFPESTCCADLINACFEKHLISWNIHHKLYRTELLQKAFQFYIKFLKMKI